MLLPVAHAVMTCRHCPGLQAVVLKAVAAAAAAAEHVQHSSEWRSDADLGMLKCGGFLQLC